MTDHNRTRAKGKGAVKEAFGGLSTDWKEGINWPAVREWRLTRAREAMARHGLGALLLMYDENMRYVSSTYTPGWNRLKPGLRYVVLCEGREPIVYEQGDIGIHLKAHNPWVPPGRRRRIRSGSSPARCSPIWRTPGSPAGRSAWTSST